MRSILITGASSGFGRNVALELARRGWRVFASMRNLEKGEALLADARRLGLQQQVSTLELDVTRQDTIDRALEAVLEQTGGTLDAHFANAGYTTIGAFEDMSDEDCRRLMETNFFGVLATCRAVIPVMRRAQRGRIVVASSNTVNTPHPMLSLYAASKWAIEGWAEAMEMELAPYGVTVRVAQLGAHKTAFNDNLVQILPPDSAYRPWLDAAWPGLAAVYGWQREAAEATAPIVHAIEAADAPFLSKVGEDTVLCSAINATFPYEARAAAVRALVGIPGAGAFVSDPAPAPAQEAWPTVTAVVNRFARGVKDNAELSRLIGTMTSSRTPGG
jgi:NAD(P)-dependent dehydrogenase (short-subunit alcohol dehydrogenase family)